MKLLYLNLNQNFLIKLFIALAIAIVLFFLSAYAVSASTYQTNCSSYAYQQCYGYNLYWYDSCGNRQGLIKYCPKGCYDNACYNPNYNYNYNPCSNHAYRLCAGNNVYWYDSCGNQQELYQNCNLASQACRYGQCVFQAPAPVPAPAPSPYIVYYRTACYGNNLYWYDTLGAVTGLYKSCSDSNSCTRDTCSGDKCSNVIKCDGSACQAGSEDYIKYCASDKSRCGNGNCEANLGETVSACPSDCKQVDLFVLFFVKNSPDSSQWEKSAESGQNSQIYFMATVQNNSAVQVNDVIVSVDAPGEIISLGNVQIDGQSVARDIVSGVNIGLMGPLSSKIITFEAVTQGFSAETKRQAVFKASLGDNVKSDFVEISFNPKQSSGTASISGAAASGFWEFLKRWYLWILVGVVLVFLFIVVFRRLSSNA